jgi:serine/threonine protein kinase
VLTGEGVAMGTPAYISPEQARGAPVDNRTDMYSLGVVMFEMLTGRLPFNYPNPNKIMLAHISEPPPAPGRFCADCPPALEEIILTTLQTSPDARYGDMRVMANALKEALVVSKPRPPIEAAPPPEILGTVNLAAPSGQTSRPTPAARPQPRLILPDRGADLPLPDQDSLIIGRTHRQTIADIDLGPYGAAENGVSRQHARLTRQAHGWLLDDLGSLNGTFINEVKVTPSQPVLLKDGDVVRCSHLSFTFRL